MNQALLALLRTYKNIVSPWLPASCRFVPTCSEYAMEAIARHGALTGSLLTAWRLARCNPISQGGLDLVPVRSVNATKIQNLEHKHSAACLRSGNHPVEGVHTVGIIDRI